MDREPLGDEAAVAAANRAMRFGNTRDNKPQFSLIDMNCLEPMARVLDFGAKKYARDNWKKGMPLTEIMDSMFRHLAALQRGEWIDPDSGLPHIGHIQCNALFMGLENNTIDIQALAIAKDDYTMSQLTNLNTEENGQD